METLTENDTKTCPRCNSIIEPLRANCAVCGELVFSQAGSELFIESRKKNSRWLKLAMYFTSAVAFSLGIMEGFLSNNSAAMTVDLIVSLIVLSLTPRAAENPVSTLTGCIFIAFAIPSLLSLLGLFPVQGWMEIRFFLLAIPAIALIVHATARRSQFNR